ncbi:hypothetical protein GW17_00034164 [Ensete ventricosum]|nr:hypothetical protein GW17_00034164 [Ensete ventricosum]
MIDDCDTQIAVRLNHAAERATSDRSRSLPSQVTWITLLDNSIIITFRYTYTPSVSQKRGTEKQSCGGGDEDGSHGRGGPDDRCWRRAGPLSRRGAEYDRVGLRTRRRGGEVCGGWEEGAVGRGDGDGQLLVLLAVASDAAGEVVVAGGGQVEEGVAVAQRHYGILQAAAVERPLRGLDYFLRHGTWDNWDEQNTLSPSSVGRAGFPTTAPQFTEGRRCLHWASLRWAHQYDRRSILTSILPPPSPNADGQKYGRGI